MFPINTLRTDADDQETINTFHLSNVGRHGLLVMCNDVIGCYYQPVLGSIIEGEIQIRSRRKGPQMIQMISLDHHMWPAGWLPFDSLNQ